MGSIAIIADSTCDHGPEGLAAKGVIMVPLKVHFGDETFQDWVDFTSDTYYAKLTSSPVHPTTSQPSPQEFADVYSRLAEEGFEGAVVITISSKLSGTFESATLAAADSPLPVRVVDSLTTSGAQALIVDHAVAVRDAGGDLEKVASEAEWGAANSEMHFVVDTLEYLVKGGRAGKAQALAASILNIKPVLHITDGVIEPFKKVKGSRKAYQEMASHVAARSSEVGGVTAMIIHASAADLADQMAGELAAAGFDGTIAGKLGIGSVIGTHVGPKSVGVATLPVR